MNLISSRQERVPSERSFARALVGVLVVLSVLVLGAGAWSLIGGPQLRSVQADGDSLHQRPGASITLQSDRAINTISEEQVRITPEARFAVTSDDLAIRLTFPELLLADTNYEVEVRGVAPRGAGNISNWRFSFSTGSFSFLFLREKDGVVDVVQADPSSSHSTVLYSAPGIQSVVSVASIVAVVREDQGDRFLELVDPLSGSAERLVLPPGFEIGELANASWGTTVVATAAVPLPGGAPMRGGLVLIDVLSDRTPEVVSDFSGSPISVKAVAVSPSSGEIIIWKTNQELSSFNPLTGLLMPMGTASELWGFNSTGTQILYVDSLGSLAQDLFGAEMVRVPRGQLDGIPVRHQKFDVAPDGTRIHRVVLPGIQDGNPYIVVSLEIVDGVHTFLTGSLGVPGSIGDIALSPNGQYLLVEVNNLTTPLGYLGLSPEQVASNTIIRVMDVKAGVVVTEFQGHSFVW